MGRRLAAFETRSGTRREGRDGDSVSGALMTSDRRTLIVVSTLLFLFAASVRVVWLVQHRPDLLSKPGFSQDESEYSGLARGILAGSGFRQAVPRQGLRALPRTGEPTAFRTPGTPAILATIYKVFGPNPGIARIVLSIATGLVSPLLFLIVVLLFQRPLIGALLGVWWAVLPTSLFLAGVLYGEESSCVILLLVLLLAILAERRGSVPLILMAGLVVGFGVLTRGFLLFTPFTVGLWLVLRGKHRLAVCLLLAASILPGAWVIRNGRTMGVYELSTESWEAVWLGNNRWARGSWPANWADQHREFLVKYPDFDQMNEIGHFRVFEQEAKRELRANPRRVLWLLPRKAAIFFYPKSWIGTDWLYGAMLPFFVAGVVLLWRDRRSRHLLALLGLPIGSVFAVSMIAFSDVRYRHPIDTLIFILGAVGLEKARTIFAARRQVAPAPSSMTST
jgi:hypothetical protein